MNGTYGVYFSPFYNPLSSFAKQVRVKSKKDPMELSISSKGSFLLILIELNPWVLLLAAVDDGTAFSNQSVIGSF